MTEKKNLNRWTSLKDYLWCFGGINRCTSNLHLQDTLKIYSSGLPEALNEAGNFFGEKKLMELLSGNSNQSSEDLGEKILAEISAFTGKAKTHDDLTIAIIKRTAV